MERCEAHFLADLPLASDCPCHRQHRFCESRPTASILKRRGSQPRVPFFLSIGTSNHLIEEDIEPEQVQGPPRVEHVFAVVKWLWGFAKVRYRGVANTYLAPQRLVA